MKYISLDVETTGLRPNYDQLLQVAMVVEDTELSGIPVEQLPYFCVIVKHEEIRGQLYALGLNGWILDLISGRTGAGSPHPILEQEEMFDAANEFLDRHFGNSGRINVAGKNAAGFDIRFLPTGISDRFRHRVIDPGSVFVDWSANCLPSLGDLIGESVVSHDALEDARDVITCLRRSYSNNKR